MQTVKNLLATCSVIDTESTSPDAKTCDIIELACSVYDMENDEWRVFDQWYKPTIAIPPLSAEKHFIRDMDVADKPMFSEFQNVDTFFQISSLVPYFVAHNEKYDRVAIQSNLKRFGLEDSTSIAMPERWFCTMRLAEKLYADDPTVESMRLTYLWFRLGLCNCTDKLIVPHKADSDIFMAGKLFEYLVEEMVQRGIVDLNSSVELGQQIHAFQTAPRKITTWPFGKHKGVSMDLIPMDYFAWCIENMSCFNEDADDFNPDLTAAVIEQYEKRG